MDIARWGLGKNTLPLKIQSSGGRFGYRDDGETPNTLVTTFEYPDAILQFEVRGLPTHDERGVKVGNIFYGSEGCLVLNGSRWATYMGKDSTPGKSGGGRGDDKAHYASFIKAVKSRDPKDLAADVEEGHLSSALCHLANIAFRVGEKLSFDPKSLTFPGAEAANRLLTREYRSPFSLPTST